jgi:hypothetical protein
MSAYHQLMANRGHWQSTAAVLAPTWQWNDGPCGGATGTPLDYRRHLPGGFGVRPVAIDARPLPLVLARGLPRGIAHGSSFRSPCSQQEDARRRSARANWLPHLSTPEKTAKKLTRCVRFQGRTIGSHRLSFVRQFIPRWFSQSPTRENNCESWLTSPKSPSSSRLLPRRV